MAYNPPAEIGFVDSDLFFATAQAIPTDGADDLSENQVDLVVAGPRAGQGTPPSVKVCITTAITVASGTASILDIVLYSKAAAATTIGACTEHGVIGSIAHTESAGRTFSFRIPQHPDTEYLRYLAIALSPRDDDTLYSAGNVDAWLDFD